MTPSNAYARRPLITALLLLGLAGLTSAVSGKRPVQVLPAPAVPAMVSEPQTPPQPTGPSVSEPSDPPLDRSTLPPGLDLDSLALLEGVANGWSEPLIPTRPIDKE